MEKRGVEEMMDDEASSPFVLYRRSVNFEYAFSFTQSWIFDVVFSSFNSKIFTSPPPIQLLHAHAGSSTEKTLEVEN